jgi:hypothetical protein
VPARNLAPAQTLHWRSWYNLQPGDGARITSFRSSRFAPYAMSKAASRWPPSPITIRDMAAITTPSASALCVRCAGIAIKASGPSTSAAIAWPLAMTACRPIRRIRSTDTGARLGRQGRGPETVIKTPKLDSALLPPPSLRLWRLLNWLKAGRVGVLIRVIIVA